MRIESVTSYRVGGVTFDSEKAARDWLEEQVGALIDNGLNKAAVIDNGLNKAAVIGPREKLALHAAILNNANALRVLLEAYAAPVE
jgi:hypothetical protein